MSPSAIKIVLMSLLPAGLLQAAQEVFFEKDIRPILKAHCFHCHGEDKVTKSGLDVRLAKWILKGGKHGPGIVPHQPEKSILLQMLQSGEMPEGKPKLPDAEIAKVEAWIKQGAKTLRAEPDTLTAEDLFTAEDRAWWSLQPISTPTPPKDHGLTAVINPIDDFIASTLKKNQLEFSQKAKPHELLRRLSYTLIGLPPTLEEAESFQKAYAENPDLAYRNEVERLLNSPHYGERWAQHWLDLAGYSDSDGYSERDLPRDHAYKFRDYVIKSLNQDKPINQFIVEQLAGDELVKWPHTNLQESDIEKIVATGFLRMAADGTGATNTAEARQISIQDTVQIIGSTLYGMTLACAQCHDHRYDPISHKDYYQVRAIFDPGFQPQKWRTPNQRLVSLYSDADKKVAAEIEAKAVALDKERLAQQAEFIEIVLQKELAKLPEADRKPAEEAYRIARAKRSPQQQALLNKYPKVNQLSAGSLYLYDHTYKTQYAETIKKMVADVAEIRATKPTEEFIHAFQEVPVAEKLLPVSKLFHRGDFQQPTDTVYPSDLTILKDWRKTDIDIKDKTLPTSGRRLTFAKILTDGEHPLLTRVFVNQIWSRVFGFGLNRSVADFGFLGEKPSHPELLDYLARRFVKEDWSLKQLHRLLVHSYTFQQSSQRHSELQERLDPDNRLLSRMNVVRLDAEAIRDSMLQATGLLNQEFYGKPVPVTLDEQNQVILGEDTRDAARRQTGKVVDLKGQEYRRSIYIQKRRSMPLEVLAAFDAPNMSEANCANRTHSTVSPQSLMLMNGGYSREYAQSVALRMEAMKFDSVDAKIHHLWNLCYQRSPSAEEVQQAKAFLVSQENFYQKSPAKLEYVSRPAEKKTAPAALMAVASLCQALLSSNEFLYVP